MTKKGEPRRRLGIVEDDDDLRLLMLLWLSPFHDCAGYASGEALLAAIGHVKPDLLILDGDLRGASGFEVAAAVRADGRFKSLPILFVTGMPHSKAEQELERHANAEFLSKPFERERLQQSVAKILAG